MLIEHKSYKLFGHLIFEKARVKSPFRMTNALQNEACFFHMVKGCSDYFADTQSLRLQPRESALLRCGNYAMHVSKTDTNTEFEFVAVHFFPEVLRKIYDKDLPSFLRDPAPNAQGVPAMSEVKNQLLLKYIDSLLFYFDNPELAHEDLLILKVKELILLLAQTNNAPRITEMLRSLFTPTTYSFRETMDAHMLSPLSTAELAELTHLSLSTFKREFMRIYQSSPAAYRKAQRLLHAKHLLTASDQRISDIAQQCGFDDLAHFSSSFRDSFGVAPSQFRLNQKPKSLD